MGEMPFPDRETRRIVEKKYREDLRRLHSQWPREQVSLEEAHAGKTVVPLIGGGLHKFDPRELEDLFSLVPPYLWHLVKIPVLLRYERIGNKRYYRVLGGVWQKRLVELMLDGDYSYEGIELLTITRFKALLTRYKSILFVTLGV